MSKIATILWTTDDVRVEAQVEYDATVILVKDDDKQRVFHYLPGQTWEGKPQFVEGSVEFIQDPGLLDKLNVKKPKVRLPIANQMLGSIPVCLEETCKHRFACANHGTANADRIRGGFTPDLLFVSNQWSCTRMVTDRHGALTP